MGGRKQHARKKDMVDQNPSSSTTQAAPSPNSLPDLNAIGKYPWGLVQELVDQVACVNMFAIPTRWDTTRTGNAAKLTGGTFDAALHRFKVDLEEPDLESGVRAKNTIGQRS